MVGFKGSCRDFSGGLVVKSLGLSSIPGWGTKSPCATKCSQKQTGSTSDEARKEILAEMGGPKQEAGSTMGRWGSWGVTPSDSVSQGISVALTCYTFEVPALLQFQIDCG